MPVMFFQFMLLQTAGCSQYFVEHNYPQYSQAWSNPSIHFQQEFDQSWSQATDSPTSFLSDSSWRVFEDFSQTPLTFIDPNMISDLSHTNINFHESPNFAEYDPSLMSFQLTQELSNMKEELEADETDNIYGIRHPQVMLPECDQTSLASKAPCAGKSLPKTHYPKTLCVDGVLSSFELEPSSQSEIIHQRQNKLLDTREEFKHPYPKCSSSALFSKLPTSNEAEDESSKVSVSTKRSGKRRTKAASWVDPFNSSSSHSLEVSSQSNFAESRTKYKNFQTDNIEKEIETTQQQIELLERGTSVKMRKLRRFVERLEKLDRNDEKFPYFSLEKINKGIEKTRKEIVELDVLKKHAEKLIKLQKRGFSLKQIGRKIEGVEKNIAFKKEMIAGREMRNSKKESGSILMEIENLEKYRDELKKDLEIWMELHRR